MVAGDEFLELATAQGGSIRVLKAMHPRARRLRLSVTPRGARVSCPRGTHATQVYAFLQENRDWLQRKLAEFQVPRRDRPPLRAGESTLILLRGTKLRLNWGEAEFPRVEQRNDGLWLCVPRPYTRALPVARGLLAAYFETHMRRDLARWVAHAAARMDAAPTGLRIKPLKSLWGSLDTRNHITLDLALALAPPVALRYVVVHEMAHLKVRSHSKRFWTQVAELMPAYQAQRDWLREHGAVLKAEMERLTVAP